MDDLRLALVLNAVSPAIGGVLVRGEKGTAKSTAVRALAAVLPAVAVVGGCRFSCDPADADPSCPDGPHCSTDPAENRPARLVELPVGASEDRLVGALDIERALAEGVKAYEPGLLAAAHRGILYVDEVNLLGDHLVDLLLDAAALGTSYVEREGVSVRHRSRFLLVGTMNPEEGELRPQLLDRFGLTVEVAAPRKVDDRAEVVRRRLGFDADPAAFTARFAEQERKLSERIVRAQASLSDVDLPDAALRQIASVCASFEVDGLRADIVIARTAIAHAAWQERQTVDAEDVRVAARLALPHRRRRNPFDAPGLDEEQLDNALSEADPPPGPAGPDDDGPGSGAAASGENAMGPSKESVAAPTETFRTRRLEVPGVGSGVAGRRSRAKTDSGRVTGSRPSTGKSGRPHLVATMAAAAPQQKARGRSGTGLVVRREDVRLARREGRESNLVLFAVDASGSMAARARMSAVKGAVLSLLLDAYQRRDKVGLVTFRGDSAEVVLPPTSSVDAAAARLTALPTGGRTPLAEGLLRAREVLRVERLRDARRRPLLVVVTDGRATGRAGSPLEDAHRTAALLASEGVAAVVVDCENGPIRLGLAEKLATVLDGPVLRLEELAVETLAASVRTLTGAA
ncbi:magnesium chelatase subunit D family protein [Fodinicola acaciae]|uniref:magnesium chelatase subunit D family protein n=1 Tax=Fodinicola acaciae TaxID=2681555 RepID=UPI001C9E823D|nr:magnesium chelatase subunit D family protein [Fodinicola acaciae]